MKAQGINDWGLC